MANRKPNKTFDVAYSMALMTSSIVFPIVVYRAVDAISAVATWGVLFFMMCDFMIRSTRQERMRKKRYKQRMDDKKFLEATRDYRKSFK